MSAYISVQVPAFNSLGHIPRRGIVGSHDNSMLTILRICHNVFHISHLTFPPNECEMVSHCRQISLICLSLSTKDIEHIVTYLFMGHLCIIGKMSIQGLCLISKWVVLFSWLLLGCLI